MQPDEPLDLPQLEPDDEPRGRAASPSGFPSVPASKPVPSTFLLDDIDDVPLAAAFAERKSSAPWWPLGWRCAVVYLVLYCLPFPFDLLLAPGSSEQTFWDAGKQAVVTKFADLLTGVQLTVFQNGSGDTTYDYFELLLYLLATLLVGGLWHLLSRPRVPGSRSRDVVRTYVRYFLASALLASGFRKAIPLQYGQLDAGQLLATYGQSSPMNLLWTFMAASPVYTVFVGLAELLAGLLLLWRRTTTLGGVVAVAVTANMVMLSFCYDVPAKLLSLHLLALAVALCLRDVHRLFALLVQNRATEPVELWPWHPSPALRWPLSALKAALVAWILFVDLRAGFEDWQQRNAEPVLRGVWMVEGFERDGAGVAPFTAPDRWRYLEIVPDSRVDVARADGIAVSYGCTIDIAQQTMTWSDLAGTDQPVPFQVHYSIPDTQHLRIDGTIDGSVVRAHCRRLGKDGFPLVTSGFHWINESPPNRR